MRFFEIEDLVASQFRGITLEERRVFELITEVADAVTFVQAKFMEVSNKVYLIEAALDQPDLSPSKKELSGNETKGSLC